MKGLLWIFLSIHHLSEITSQIFIIFKIKQKTQWIDDRVVLILLSGPVVKASFFSQCIVLLLRSSFSSYVKEFSFYKKNIIVCNCIRIIFRLKMVNNTEYSNIIEWSVVATTKQSSSLRWTRNVYVWAQFYVSVIASSLFKLYKCEQCYCECSVLSMCWLVICVLCIVYVWCVQMLYSKATSV